MSFFLELEYAGFLVIRIINYSTMLFLEIIASGTAVFGILYVVFIFFSIRGASVHEEPDIDKILEKIEREEKLKNNEKPPTDTAIAVLVVVLQSFV